MSPQLTVSTSESSGSGSGVPTGTGTVFVAIGTDAGPPPTGPAYVRIQSMTAFVNAFGPRSSTSSTGYDFLDEYFHDAPAGASAYVTRVTDSTATTAAVTLNDALPSPKPTVVVSALTPGTEGNNTTVSVATGTNATFTATTATNTALTAISSFKNIGPGTPISGSGIAAGTYIVSVNTGANSAVLSQATTATASSVVMTPGTVTLTVTVNDSAGNLVGTETHGPYNLTSQLYADTTSSWVVFSQSAGSGFTLNLPAASAAVSLTGGADANDLTDASFVAALANFPASLGAGTVCLPGKTSATAWSGLLAHAAAKNRFAVLDMADNASAASVLAAAAALTPGAAGSYGMLIQGSLTLPAISGTTTRTCPGSAAVAALRAQVSVTANQALAPCGTRFPLTYPLGFTTFHGPIPAGTTTTGSFSAADVQTLESAGVPVNVFANFQGSLCLYGFVSTLSSTVEAIYDQATASCERMALVNDAQIAMAPYLFDPINTATIESLTTDLNGMCLAHFRGGALYGDTPADAFAVAGGTPINTPQTAQARQLNAQISARIVRYADTVNTQIAVIPVTVSLPAASS